MQSKATPTGSNLSWKDVKTWKKSLLEEFGNGIKSDIDRLLRCQDDLTAIKADGKWAGAAANKAREESGKIDDQLKDIVATLSAMQKGIYRASDELGGLEDSIKNVLSFCDSHQFSVSDHGQVSDTSASRTFPSAQSANDWKKDRQDRARTLQNDVDRIIKRAHEIDSGLDYIFNEVFKGIDDKGKTTLSDARAEGNRAVRSSALQEALAASKRSEIPSDPREVRDFWNNLSEELKARLIAEDPRKIGNLNGIPTVDRDAANRKYHETRREHYRQLFTRAGLPVEYTFKGPGDLERFKEGTSRDKNAKKWDDLNFPEGTNRDTIYNEFLSCLKVEESLNNPGKDLKSKAPRYLLAYDLEAYGSKGRCAIAYGNPDTAKNVAVCIPGLNSSVTKMNEICADADALQAGATYVAPSESTAVIAWQGYQTPGLGTVASQHRAEAGAKLLSQDVAALRVNSAPDARFTVIGHSYGSTTTGLALHQEGLAKHVDNAVLLGSPGAGSGVNNVKDLHMSSDHVFIGSASNDPVTNMNQTLGSDPATKDFGATRIKAENTTLKEGLDRIHGWSNHSLYYDYDKGMHGEDFQINKNKGEALRSVERIVTGRSGDLGREDLLAPHREELSPPVGTTEFPHKPTKFDPEAHRHLNR
ncbi:hypothetical protein KEM60_01284 [Austwickia sp. TVS 96-490-7B]|uniref:alpha/beta hydrolase n=1 Tax=Austwickia sp. TVS 96-490-7B TaxID=2830843 RepID=UPI001C57B9F1|nr:alpha/beta hydrolase [Austwickia sp. TVS 96-490-7B]MBW3085091.1 hypothetical protein [Austwickia sp. TVS 96-490-7B]